MVKTLMLTPWPESGSRLGSPSKHFKKPDMLLVGRIFVEVDILFPKMKKSKAQFIKYKGTCDYSLMQFQKKVCPGRSCWLSICGISLLTAIVGP